MTRSQIIALAVAKVDAIASAGTHGEPEGDHAYADDVLLTTLRRIGAGDLADAYDRLVDRSRWWAAA